MNVIRAACIVPGSYVDYAYHIRYDTLRPERSSSGSASMYAGLYIIRPLSFVYAKLEFGNEALRSPNDVNPLS
ncbi:hypothetical protein T07_1331 [Trichinella nelsoni]|uniref:Uncharacterized protein n=1 Tax=Trichinella nelsoni TaxID=6336 RepID=A0A0V0RI85_9BILA|nr:hypothetical protein T07_1331 [Trichinella nelsoni]